MGPGGGPPAAGPGGPPRGPDPLQRPGGDPWTNRLGIGQHDQEETFAHLHADNDKARERETEHQELREKLQSLESMVERLSAIAAEAKRDKGSSLVRARRTAHERTQGWLRRHGVLEFSSAASAAPKGSLGRSTNAPE